MEDITPGLFETIQSKFKEKFDESGRISELYKRVRDGTATYQTAQDIAIEVGNILANVFGECIHADILPDGRMYYNIASRIIPPMLENNFDITAEMAKEIQQILNTSAGLGIKAVRPELNQDKIDGIVDIVSGAEKYDEISYMLKDPIVNFTQCVVDDTVRANADFQDKAGLSPKIVRTSSGKCCEWCDKLDGVYDYSSVRNTGNDVFRRHKNCICLVELVTDKEMQNAHTKQWAQKDDINRRIQNSLSSGKKLNQYTREQAEELEKKLKIKYMKPKK